MLLRHHRYMETPVARRADPGPRQDAGRHRAESKTERLVPEARLNCQSVRFRATRSCARRALVLLELNPVRTPGLIDASHRTTCRFAPVACRIGSTEHSEATRRVRQPEVLRTERVRSSPPPGVSSGPDGRDSRRSGPTRLPPGLSRKVHRRTVPQKLQPCIQRESGVAHARPAIQGGTTY